MSKAAIVQLLAMTLLIVISGARAFDATLDVTYRAIHGAVVGLAVGAIVWRLRTLRQPR